MQADTNEVMAASVVYLSNVDVDRPLSKAAWNNSQALRHFSILRKLDGVPFPAGATFKAPAHLWRNACVCLLQKALVVCLVEVMQRVLKLRPQASSLNRQTQDRMCQLHSSAGLWDGRAM